MTRRRKRTRRRQPEHILHSVDEGYCKMSDLWEAIKRSLLRSWSFAEMREFLTRHNDIVGLKYGVVTWNVSYGRDDRRGLRRSRGLDEAACRAALDLMCKKGIIEPDQYYLPPDLHAENPIVDLREVENEAEHEEEPETEIPVVENTREKWSTGAKTYIVEAVKIDQSPEQIVEGLIEGEFRRPGLTTKTLQRQIKRMPQSSELQTSESDREKDPCSDQQHDKRRTPDKISDPDNMFKHLLFQSLLPYFK